MKAARAACASRPSGPSFAALPGLSAIAALSAFAALPAFSRGAAGSTLPSVDACIIGKACIGRAPATLGAASQRGRQSENRDE
jgi:hypothetical protein